MKLVLLPIAATLFAVPRLAQSAGEPSNLEAGKAFAGSICSECHVVADSQTEPGRIDAPSFCEIASDPATTGFQLRAYLRTPHFVMPNIILSPEETDDVVGYILSLKGR